MRRIWTATATPTCCPPPTRDDKIAWYENLGGGSFSAPSVLSTSADGVQTVRAADLDGDGDADVVSASYSDDRIAWFENLSDHGDDHGEELENATLATALPAFLHGVLESAGDKDVFRVATGRGTLRMYSNGPTDTFGVLLDADGAQLASDHNTGATLNFRLELGVAEGVHYVEVSGNEGVTGPYTLSIEFVAADDHPDSREAATPVASLPWSGGGELERTGDRDVFRVEVDGPGTLTAYTTGTTDTYGKLTDAAGAVLAEDDDSRDGSNFEVESEVDVGTLLRRRVRRRWRRDWSLHAVHRVPCRRWNGSCSLLGPTHYHDRRGMGV